MIVRDADGYCVVIDAAGRIIAQGRRGMCERVAAGLPVLVWQGDLFDNLPLVDSKRPG